MSLTDKVIDQIGVGVHAVTDNTAVWQGLMFVRLLSCRAVLDERAGDEFRQPRQLFLERGEGGEERRANRSGCASVSVCR